MCDCKQKINENLAATNNRLFENITWTNGVLDRVLSIETEIIEKKRGAKRMYVMPTYCPFCGTMYAKQPDTTAPQRQERT